MCSAADERKSGGAELGMTQRMRHLARTHAPDACLVPYRLAIDPQLTGLAARRTFARLTSRALSELSPLLGRDAADLARARAGQGPGGELRRARGVDGSDQLLDPRDSRRGNAERVDAEADEQLGGDRVGGDLSTD